jgi:transcriptional regulator with XRE-family HTH domain
MELIDAGKCLKLAQKDTGINSAKLARMTGTSPQQLLRWRASKNMKLHTIQILSFALGISISDFITFGSK